MNAKQMTHRHMTKKRFAIVHVMNDDFVIYDCYDVINPTPDTQSSERIQHNFSRSRENFFKDYTNDI